MNRSHHELALSTEYENKVSLIRNDLRTYFQRRKQGKTEVLELLIGPGRVNQNPPQNDPLLLRTGNRGASEPERPLVD